MVQQRRCECRAFLGVEMYLGFRPTAPWSQNFGNEGDLGTGGFGRWMKKIGLGNFGAALRGIKKGEEWT
jgi:hypothetical protein